MSADATPTPSSSEDSEGLQLDPSPSGTAELSPTPVQEEGLSLSEESTSSTAPPSDESFAPYVVTREPAWALLPVLALLVTAIHLKKIGLNSSKTHRPPPSLQPQGDQKP